VIGSGLPAGVYHGRIGHIAIQVIGASLGQTGNLLLETTLEELDDKQFVSSIKVLSLEQTRPLRQQLDRQNAEPKKPTAPTPGVAAKRTKPACQKKDDDGAGSRSAPVQD
jgi:hypothetical protein